MQRGQRSGLSSKHKDADGTELMANSLCWFNSSIVQKFNDKKTKGRNRRIAFSAWLNEISRDAADAHPSGQGAGSGRKSCE